MKVYAKIFEKNGLTSKNVTISDNSISFKGKTFLFEKTFIATQEINNNRIFEKIIPDLIESELFVFKIPEDSFLVPSVSRYSNANNTVLDQKTNINSGI